MKIAHIVSSLNFGGLENLVIQLAEQLNKDDFPAIIICIGEKGPLGLKAEQKGLKVFAFDKGEGFNWRLIPKMAKLLKNERVDIVHTHNFAPLVYGTLAGRLAGLKCLNTRHGRANIKAPGWLWSLNKRIVAVSQDAKTQLITNNRIPFEKVSLIYNGIDLSRFKNKWDDVVKRDHKKELGIPEGALIIGNIARLSEEKDHATLLEAFARIVGRNINAVLLVVGDGDQKEPLVDLARELELTWRVQFLGFREDIPRLLQVFDVFVLCSTMEGISLTLLEAMAAAKPVVATAVGGNPEVVEEKKTGYLVPAADPEKLADGIINVLRWLNTAEEMGQAGRKRAEAMFSLERMVDAYKKIYQNL